MFDVEVDIGDGNISPLGTGVTGVVLGCSHLWARDTCSLGECSRAYLQRRIQLGGGSDVDRYGTVLNPLLYMVWICGLARPGLRTRETELA